MKGLRDALMPPEGLGRFSVDEAETVRAAIRDAASTVGRMPAHFIRRRQGPDAPVAFQSPNADLPCYC